MAKGNEKSGSMHGVDKRLHLAVDANTQEIVAVKLTANFVGDAESSGTTAPEEALASVAADGAYDTVHGYHKPSGSAPKH